MSHKQKIFVEFDVTLGDKAKVAIDLFEVESVSTNHTAPQQAIIRTLGQSTYYVSTKARRDDETSMAYVLRRLRESYILAHGGTLAELDDLPGM